MVEPAHPPTNIRISRIVVGKPPQLLKSDVPKPVPVIIDITLNEANLRASKNILDVIKDKAALDEDIEKSITDLIEEVSKEFIKSE